MGVRTEVFLTVLSVAIPALAAEPPADDVAANFELQELAHGVWAALRQDPPGLMCDGNSVFIVGDEDVVVIDAPEASRELLRALREITDKPVSVLVNTHWHDDHLTGNGVFRQAFPDLEIVGHASMREYLPERGAENRSRMIEGAPGGLEMLRDHLARGVNLSGQPLDSEERSSYESDIRLVEHYLEVVPGTPLVQPTLTVEDRLTLHRGGRVVEVLHLGRGHTAADLVVHLPAEGIVIAGDLVVWPVPLVGAEQSHVRDWSRTLERLVALAPARVVPGHGPVLEGVEYPRRMAALFASVADRTEAAAKDGASLEAVRAAVDLSSERRLFAGRSRLLGALFDVYVAGPAVAAALGALSP